MVLPPGWEKIWDGTDAPMYMTPAEFLAGKRRVAAENRRIMRRSSSMRRRSYRSYRRSSYRKYRKSPSYMEVGIGLAAGYFGGTYFDHQETIMTLLAVIDGIPGVGKSVPWQIRRAARGYVMGRVIKMNYPNLLKSNLVNGVTNSGNATHVV